MQKEIIPARLSAERSRRGWTQKKLAAEAGLSLRQIVSLEKEREDGHGHPVRTATLEKLTKALAVEEVRLIEEDPERPVGMQPHGAKIELWLSSIDRLRFDLIEEQTGLSMDELVSAAPLLYKLAECLSLAWRRDKLAEATSHLANLRDAARYVMTAEQEEALSAIEQELAEEAASIESREVFRASERSSRHVRNSNRFLDWVDTVADDPEEIELIGLRKVFLAPDRTAVPHNVCRRRLYEIAGHPEEEGAEQAIYALATGSVRLKDIPPELRSEDKRADRIAWLGAHVDGLDENWWCVDTFPSLRPETRYASTRSPEKTRSLPWN